MGESTFILLIIFVTIFIVYFLYQNYRYSQGLQLLNKKEDCLLEIYKAQEIRLNSITETLYEDFEIKTKDFVEKNFGEHVKLISDYLMGDVEEEYFIKTMKEYKNTLEGEGKDV